MFVRRSRKGRIHVVRERVADGYARLSKGLARANKGVIDGVWSVHKGLQLGLAKGHQGVQSGLKTVQDFTGDFSMYYQRNSYYQYEEPVAMFSMAEIEKYNKYEKGDYAAFGLAEAVKTPFRAIGYQAAKGMRSVADAAAGKLKTTMVGPRVKTGVQKLGEAADWASMNTGKVGAGLVGAGLTAGAGGAMFLRRRRTKKGKIVVEQVRR